MLLVQSTLEIEREEKNPSLSISHYKALIKTYEVRHLQNEIDWITNSNWFIGMNDGPFTVVILGSKQYSNVAIATLFGVFCCHWTCEYTD